MSRSKKLIFACAIAFALAAVLQGQESRSSSSGRGANAIEPESLPDAPDTALVAPTERVSSSKSADTEQTKRILGFIPNFRSVSADVTLPPQTTKEKFTIGLQDTFDYSNLIFVGAQAGLSQATNSYPAFHQGARGYGRYYWHTFADQSDENLLVESVLPAAFHEDSRYYTLGHGGILRRTAYAMSRALITRSDSGTEVFNAAEIIGAGGAAGISSAYYPGQYCTWTKTGQRWLTNVILDTANSVVREFWPDVHNAFRHHRRAEID
jgi:hypothetical protein